MSQQGGGLSAYEVQSIVGSMLNSRVGPIESELRSQQRALAALEEEMSSIGRAVDSMASHLGTKLDGLAHSQRELIRVQESTRELTREQFVAANAQLGGLRAESAVGFGAVSTGLGAVSGDVKVVDASLQQLTRATVQMEVIRLLNEARGPVQKIHAFSEEIDQRFAKAIESVYVVRSQYDQLLGTAMAEYQHKLRTIGDHIYAIYEQDFRDHAELPLSAPADQVQSLALALDEQMLEARSEALDADLSDVGRESLEPLLSAHHAFEHTLATRFATRVSAAGERETVGVPAVLRVWGGGPSPFEVVAGARLREDRGVGAREGLNFSIEEDPALRTWTAGLATRANEIVSQARARRLGPQEVAQLKEALTAQARAGRIDPSLLQGYFDYLDHFGLEMVEPGTVAIEDGGGR